MQHMTRLRSIVVPVMAIVLALATAAIAPTNAFDSNARKDRRQESTEEWTNHGKSCGRNHTVGVRDPSTLCPGRGAGAPPSRIPRIPPSELL